MDKYNKEKAIIMQKIYTEKNGSPHFAPKDGVCWKCRNNIYEKQTKTKIYYGKEKEITTGITVEQAKTELITGCPHCNISYCS